MHIHTMDENYDYRMRRLVEKFVQDYEIEEREPTALEDIIWKEYAEEFGRMVLEDMIEYAEAREDRLQRVFKRNLNSSRIRDLAFRYLRVRHFL